MNPITLVTLLVLAAASAHATTITFDTKASGQEIGLYEGIDFGITTAFTYNEYNTYWYNNQPSVSGNMFGYFAYVPAYSATTLTVRSADPFIFDGTYLAGWAAYDQIWQHSATSLSIEGYRNNTLVASLPSFAMAPQMQYITTGWTTPVDTLVFIPIPSTSEKYFLMDNFTFTPYTEPAQPIPNPVPEPSTLLLLGAGLAGAALFRRTREG